MIEYANDDAFDFTTTQELLDREKECVVNYKTYEAIPVPAKHLHQCNLCAASTDIHLCSSLPPCGISRRQDKQTIYWRVKYV